MLRFGNITEVDPQKGYARVTFTDDGIVSDWLQFVVLGAIKDSFSHTFSINEQVACLMDENSEQGVILGAIFNDKTSPKGAGNGIYRVQFEDGTEIQYDKNSKEYDLDVKGKINIKSSSEVNIEAVNVNVKATAIAKIESPAIQLNGAVSVSGALTIGGTVSGPSGAPINGNIEVTGDMKAGTVSLKTHVHTSTTNGNPTSPPLP